jgi:UDP-GlcNAc:undecaprenyl-phosphate/decaprenyl-phosphate GlcNAc-1-phosphate transferase
MDFVSFMNSIGIAKPLGIGWWSVVFTFILAWMVTQFFIPKVRTFALKVGWADAPNARRLNREPLANAGGLAIYAGVIAALIFATCISPSLVVKYQVQMLAILLGASVLVLVGFIDDQFGLPPSFRLLVQLLAALLLVSCKIRIELEYFGIPYDPLLSTIVSVFWIVAITNAVNLMDGMDGLAGGISFITAMSLLAVSAQLESRGAATLLLAGVSGSALGFLRYNYHPSRIIMGDAGAYFLGYVLAATSLLGNTKATTPFTLVPILMFLLVPIVDTTQVVVGRLLAGKNPLSTPGKDHLHHRLLAAGLSQRRSAIILWSITLAANIIAMHLQKTRSMAIVVAAAGIMLLLTLTVWQRVGALAKPETSTTLDPTESSEPSESIPLEETKSKK